MTLWDNVKKKKLEEITILNDVNLLIVVLPLYVEQNILKSLRINMEPTWSSLQFFRDNILSAKHNVFIFSFLLFFPFFKETMCISFIAT